MQLRWPKYGWSNPNVFTVHCCSSLPLKFIQKLCSIAHRPAHHTTHTTHTTPHTPHTRTHTHTTHRTEWLEMKAMYRDLQKEHIKQLKAEPQHRPGGEGNKQMGFVSQCLVRVKCEGEEVVTCRQLKVRLVALFICLASCLKWLSYPACICRMCVPNMEK